MITLESHLQILNESDKLILDDAISVVKSGITENEGVALKAAVSRILECQAKLANLKGMIMYALPKYRNDLTRIWKDMYDTYSSSKLPKYMIDTYTELDPQFQDTQRTISAMEATIAHIDEINWTMKSMLRFYNP